MLDDLTANCQRLSAKLPPDGWDANLPAVRITRQLSGILKFVAPEHESTDHLTKRHDSAANLDSNRDIVTAGTKATGEQDKLLSAGRAQRRTSEEGGDRVNQNESKCVCQSLKDFVLKRWTRSNSTTSIAPQRSVLQRMKNGLRRLWPFQKSDSMRRTSGQEHAPGTEPLL